jgi:hypothetical protein
MSENVNENDGVTIFVAPEKLKEETRGSVREAVTVTLFWVVAVPAFLASMAALWMAWSYQTVGPSFWPAVGGVVLFFGLLGYMSWRGRRQQESTEDSRAAPSTEK